MYLYLDLQLNKPLIHSPSFQHSDLCRLSVGSSSQILSGSQTWTASFCGSGHSITVRESFWSYTITDLCFCGTKRLTVLLSVRSHVFFNELSVSDSLFSVGWTMLLRKLGSIKVPQSGDEMNDVSLTCRGERIHWHWECDTLIWVSGGPSISLFIYPTGNGCCWNW